MVVAPQDRFQRVARKVKFPPPDASEAVGAIRSVEDLRSYLLQAMQQLSANAVAEYFDVSAFTFSRFVQRKTTFPRGSMVEDVLRKLHDFDREFRGVVVTLLTPRSIIGAMLRNVRIEQCMTQEVLASNVGISIQQCRLLEKAGVSGPATSKRRDPEAMRRVCAFLERVRHSDKEVDDVVHPREARNVPSAPPLEDRAAVASPGTLPDVSHPDQESTYDDLVVELTALTSKFAARAGEDDRWAQLRSIIGVDISVIDAEEYRSPIHPSRAKDAALEHGIDHLRPAVVLIRYVSEVLGRLASIADEKTRDIVREEILPQVDELFVILEYFQSKHPGGALVLFQRQRDFVHRARADRRKR
jgi:hypothetical protein